MALLPSFNDNWIVSSDLFGGNILADWGSHGDMGVWAAAIEELGVSTLRYPGGSLTERYFDLDNPDEPRAVHNETGQVKDWIILSDFLEYANENGHDVSIVLPTKIYLSENLDENGHRLPEIDEDSLRTFIRDVVSGRYGEATINAFEIGNEYWHSGVMDAVEYGRLAKEMASIIKSELDSLQGSGISADAIEVLVQMGYNYGSSYMGDSFEHLNTEQILSFFNEQYNLSLDDSALNSSGSVNWTHINNKLIMSFFEGSESIATIDGIISHVYSLGEVNEWSRFFELKNLTETWIEAYPDLSIHVTEWNLKGVTNSLDRDLDYGLFQAEEILNLLEEFVLSGVDHAQVWPLIQNTANAFSLGFEYGETNAPGAMFAILAEKLPGMELLDFNPTSDRETEWESDGLSVHGFSGNGDLLLYIFTDHDSGTHLTNLDLSELVLGYGQITVSILGVEEGAQPGSNASVAVLTTMTTSEVFENGLLSVPLQPGEVIQVEVEDYLPTEGASNPGDDILRGSDFGDVYFGGAGNDVFYVGGGDDSIYGGTGFDKATFSFSLSEITAVSLIGQVMTITTSFGDSLLDGVELLNFTDGSFSTSGLISWFDSYHLIGTSGADQLVAAGGVTFLEGLEGSDVIIGGALHDTILGGEGDDLVRGLQSGDTIEGGLGDDTLNGNAGNDHISGGAGADFINGGIHSDDLFGGDGEDFILGAGGIDLIYGGAGADHLNGGNFHDEIHGDGGNDLILGGLGFDTLFGGHGNDEVYGLGGHDTLEGGGGSDQLFGGEGQDQLFGNSGNDTLDGGINHDFLDGGWGDDTLFGSGGSDSLLGQNGNDTLFGGGGNDRLGGGRGNDILFGGIGADTFVFVGQHGSDIISDFNTGKDRILLGSDVLQDGVNTATFLETHATLTATGVLLDFGEGNAILVEGNYSVSDLNDVFDFI